MVAKTQIAVLAAFDCCVMPVGEVDGEAEILMVGVVACALSDRGQRESFNCFELN